MATGRIESNVEKITSLVFSFAPYMLLLRSKKSLPRCLNMLTIRNDSKITFILIIKKIAILEYHGKFVLNNMVNLQKYLR